MNWWTWGLSRLPETDGGRWARGALALKPTAEPNQGRSESDTSWPAGLPRETKGSQRLCGVYGIFHPFLGNSDRDLLVNVHENDPPSDEVRAAS